MEKTQIEQLLSLMNEMKKLDETFKENYVIPRRHLSKQINELKAQILEENDNNKNEQDIGPFNITISNEQFVKIPLNACGDLDDDLVTNHTKTNKRVRWKLTKEEDNEE